MSGAYDHQFNTQILNLRSFYMISFVWPDGEPMLAGTGGSETFTAGHVREMVRRGIDVQVVVIGKNITPSRKSFPDLPFKGLKSPSEISDLPGRVVFINRAYDVPTKNKAVLILHCAVPSKIELPDRKRDAKGKILISNSVYNAQQWALYLGIPSGDINVVLPFADPIFGNVKRFPKAHKRQRVLYAGRLHPEKGIYTLLEMLHSWHWRRLNTSMTIVMAGQHVEEGRVIARMLRGYPYAKLIQPKNDVKEMAKLLARTDILLMPSSFEEPFGMLSVEAQHAGCRVIASSIGGLPETNCGLLTLVEKRNPTAIIAGVKAVSSLGAPVKKAREIAKKKFTLQESVSDLLSFI